MTNCTIDCWNTFAVYAVTCNITVDKVGAAEAGYYSVQIQNDFGLETVVYEITYYGNMFCICDWHFERYTCLELFVVVVNIKSKTNKK